MRLVSSLVGYFGGLRIFALWWDLVACCFLGFGGVGFDFETGFVAPLSQVWRSLLQQLHVGASVSARARGCSCACL